MQVRRALMQAGFILVTEDAEAEVIGLSVIEVPTGVLVRWTVSDAFTALANDQGEACGDTIQEAVRAAVSALLLQEGHTVTRPLHHADLLLLTS
ncbi:hypothetical protein [Streptomyces sp. NPDC058305]